MAIVLIFRSATSRMPKCHFVAVEVALREIKGSNLFKQHKNGCL